MSQKVSGFNDSRSFITIGLCRCIFTKQTKTIKMIHSKARRMVSHNKKWNYIFHIEDDFVIVDRILPSKLIRG